MQYVLIFVSNIFWEDIKIRRGQTIALLQSMQKTFHGFSVFAKGDLIARCVLTLLLNLRLKGLHRSEKEVLSRAPCCKQLTKRPFFVLVIQANIPKNPLK